VHIASRALSEATGGQVIVTRTVRDLATGTDLVFRSLGSVGLRGVPGEWELFAARDVLSGRSIRGSCPDPSIPSLLVRRRGRACLPGTRSTVDSKEGSS
jgi:hypothetical protein